MSSLSSDIGDMERRIAKCRLVLKRFPDAFSDTLPDGRSVFMADGPAEWADKATMVVDPKGTVYVVPYTIVEEVVGDYTITAYVFGSSYHHARAEGALARLKLNHPEAYALWEKCVWSESVATRETRWP